MAYRSGHYRRGHYRRNRNGGYSYVRGTYVGGHYFNKTGNAGNGGHPYFRGSYISERSKPNANSNLTVPDKSGSGCLFVILKIYIPFIFGTIALGCCFIYFETSRELKATVVCIGVLSMLVAISPFLFPVVKKKVEQYMESRRNKEETENQSYCVKELDQNEKEALVEKIRNKGFMITKEGYRVSEVTSFLNEICNAIELQTMDERLLNRSIICKKTFFRDKKGYNIKQVRKHLEWISEQLWVSKKERFSAEIQKSPQISQGDKENELSDQSDFFQGVSVYHDSYGQGVVNGFSADKKQIYVFFGRRVIPFPFPDVVQQGNLKKISV